MDPGGRDELIRHRGGGVEGHARAHAVADGDLRTIGGGGVVRDRIEDRLRVRDDGVRRHAPHDAHQPRPVGLVAHPREVEGQLLAGPVEQVGRDAVVAVGGEAARVDLDLVAVADPVH